MRKRTREATWEVVQQAGSPQHRGADLGQARFQAALLRRPRFQRSQLLVPSEHALRRRLLAGVRS